MHQKISLTDAEWQIMQCLWQESPLTIAQMVNALKDQTGWSKHAVISLLKRMQAKDSVKVEDDGRVKRFFPTVGKEEVYVAETQGFLSKLYNGKIGLMLTSMVENEALSDEEIDELQSILDKSRKGTKK